MPDSQVFEMQSWFRNMAERLLPLPRNQSGMGVDETFAVLAEELPITRLGIDSGTAVLDWTVPPRWDLRRATIMADVENSAPLVDSSESLLHVVAGSQPIDQILSAAELRPHLTTLPEFPGRIAYRTCFGRDDWGFCVRGDQFQTLMNGGPWHVQIDASVAAGPMSIAEAFWPPRQTCDGETVDDGLPEFLVHTHTCHPNLGNDNLSGILVAAAWLRCLKSEPAFAPERCPVRFRFVFAAATIGPIAYLAIRGPELVDRVRGGLVLTLLGGNVPPTYKRSRHATDLINDICERTLAFRENGFRARPFTASGYDERQYNSPGFDLPIGRLSRHVEGEFDEYHTSADDRRFLDPADLMQSLSWCQAIGMAFMQRADELLQLSKPAASGRGVMEVASEHAMQLDSEMRLDGVAVSTRPFGEPNLRRHDLHRAMGQRDDRGDFQACMMTLLNAADGRRTLESIAEGRPFPASRWTEVAMALRSCGLLRLYDPGVLQSGGSRLSCPSSLAPGKYTETPPPVAD